MSELNLRNATSAGAAVISTMAKQDSPQNVTIIDQGNIIAKRHLYKILGIDSKKNDFTQGVACFLQGLADHLEDTDGKRCDEVISHFVHLKYTGSEDIFGDAGITVIIPHCLSRSSAIYREPVIKAKINNMWTTLPTEEISIDDYKDVKFVQAVITNNMPSHVCVVSRYKKDTIKFTRATSRNTSSVDQRLTIRSEHGSFHSKKTFTLQVQPIDSSAIARLQKTVTNGQSLLCSSSIVSIGWNEEKFYKPVWVNLPIPPNPVKIKKLAKLEAAKADGEKKRKQEISTEVKTNKWYMGIYGEDENDLLLLFHYDIMSESWTHLAEIQITEMRKDLISFQMAKPLHKFVVLRCRTEIISTEARKLVYALEEQLTVRPVRFILFQSPREHSDVTIYCVSSHKFDSIYENLYQDGWRFHGSSGPPASKEIMLKEGSMFDVSLRGNIKLDERFRFHGKKMIRYYNSQMPCQASFTVTELDRHLQRNYDFFKGLCMIQLVDKNQTTEFNPANSSAGPKKSSHHFLQMKKAASSIVSERKKPLCELMVQLAKAAYNTVYTPRPNQLPINLDHVYQEAIDVLSAKLGKEWEVLAKNLGLAQGRIEAIKTRNKQTPEHVKTDMLYTWIKQQPKASDRLPKLYYALMNCGRIDLAYRIEDLYCGSDDMPIEIIITDGNTQANDNPVIKINVEPSESAQDPESSGQSSKRHASQSDKNPTKTYSDNSSSEQN